MSAKTSDPYEQASALVETTRSILDKLEKNWPNSPGSRQCLGPPYTSEIHKLDEEVPCKVVEKASQRSSSRRMDAGRSQEKVLKEGLKNTKDKTQADSNRPSKTSSKSTRRSKSDLLQMINRLESEIQELKLAYQVPNDLANPGLTLLDIVSSTDSSPVKRASLAKTQLTTATYRVSDNGKILTTDRIIDKGMVKLNKHYMEGMTKSSSSRDVALQVSLSDGSEDECAFVEDLTTQLIQRPYQNSSLLVKRRAHSNVHHLVISPKESEPEIANRSRLTIHRIPDVVIPKSLSRQSLPSVQILPEPSGVIQQIVENVAMCSVNHASSAPSESSVITAKGRSAKSTRRSNSARANYCRKNVDASLQVDMSESASISFSDENHSLERRISDFIAMYKRHQTGLDVNVDDNREVLDELQSRIRMTRKKCEKYRITSPVYPGPSRNAKKSVAEAIDSSDDFYESDFEAESVPKQDISIYKTPSNDLIDFSKNSSLPSLERDQSRPQTPVALSKSLSPSNNADNESLIEIQMKRLGMSPERQHLSGGKRRHRHSKARRKVDLDVEAGGDQKLYMKSGGKFIPVEPASRRANVQIIVPEIVVKLPEPREVAFSSSPLSSNKLLVKSPDVSKRDQVIQTDEGCGTMTSGETSSMLEKMNAHQFERTQSLIDRMRDIGGFESSPNRTVLSLLHKRIDREVDNSKHSCWISGGERLSTSTLSFSHRTLHRPNGHHDASLGEVVSSTKVPSP